MPIEIMLINGEPGLHIIVICIASGKRLSEKIKYQKNVYVKTKPGFLLPIFIFI